MTHLARFAVLFDMDGTLVNNHSFHLKAWERFSERHQLGWDRAGYTSLFGGTNRDILRRLFHAQLAEADIAHLAQEKEQIYRELYAPELAPADGALELIEALRKLQVPLAVATNGIRANLQFVLQGLHLTDAFPVQLSIEDVAQGKPHPDLYLLAAERLGVAPRDCVVLEDSIPGIQAAKAADMAVVAISSTLPPDELEAEGVDLLIRHFAEVTPQRLAELAAKRQSAG